MTRILALIFLLTIGTARLEAGFVDSINGSATPGSNSFETIEWASNGQGWQYTPTFSYTLTGISTNFGQSNGTLVTPQITVQIQTDRPSNGGTVLGEGTFQGNSADGGTGGASVGPINVVAGQTYFVDFLNDLGMGVNTGLWQTVAGMPTPSNGATVNLGTEYYDLIPTSGFATSIPNGAYVSFFGTSGFSTVQLSGAEPILFFSGFRQTAATPEPSTIVMAAIALGGLLALRRRKV